MNRIKYFIIFILIFFSSCSVIFKKDKYKEITYKEKIDFFLESAADCRPKPYAEKIKYYGAQAGIDMTDMKIPLLKMEKSEAKYKDEIYEKSFSFWIGEEPLMLQKMLQPEGRLATMVFTEHPDGGSADSLKAVYLGTSDEKSPDFMKKGFVGNDIRTSRSEWLFGEYSVNGTCIYVIHPKTGDIVVAEEFPFNSDELDVKQKNNETKRLAEFVKQIPDGYYAAVVMADCIAFETRYLFFEAMESLGSAKIRDIKAFDNYCMLGIKGAAKGTVHECLVCSRFTEDTGVSKSAVIDVNLISLPLRVHLVSSGKYDNASVSIDIYRNGVLLFPPDKPSSQKLTGILDCKEKLKTIKILYEHGIEIGPHTIRPSNDLDIIEWGLKLFKKEFNTRFWIDHGFNFEDMVVYGGKKGNDYYVLDKLEANGIEYVWNWWDMGLFLLNSSEIDPSDFPVNMLYPYKNNKLPVLFYDSSRLDDNPGDNKSITIFNASMVEYSEKGVKDYKIKHITDLINEQGVHISHSYFTNQKGTYVIKKGDNWEISPFFEEFLNRMKKCIDDKTLWNPTISEFGDYIKSLSKIKTIHLTPNKVMISNENNFEVKNVSFAVKNFKKTPILLNKSPITRYKYINNDLIFWFDLGANSNVILENENEIKSTKNSFQYNKNKNEIMNSGYRAVMKKNGTTDIYSLNNIKLLSTGSFLGKYEEKLIDSNSRLPKMNYLEDENERSFIYEWKNLDDIELTIKYKFYEDSGKIDCIYIVKYLNDMNTEEEKTSVMLDINRKGVLSHAFNWLNTNEKYVYPEWMPAYAIFGDKDESVYFYGSSSMIKTEIQEKSLP